jgi:hypothetical protein
MIEQLLKKEIYCIAYKNGPAFARPVAVLKKLYRFGNNPGVAPWSWMKKS